MTESKSISTDNFKIENNIISFNITLLQISNISQVSVEPVPKKKFYYWSILLLVMGMLFTGIDISSSLSAFGAIMIVGTIIYIIVYFILFFVNNDDMCLHIYLNSGNAYCFLSNNIKFLENVMEVIEYCINYHYVNKIDIDFKHCELVNSPLIIGNENEVQQ